MGGGRGRDSVPRLDTARQPRTLTSLVQPSLGLMSIQETVGGDDSNAVSLLNDDTPEYKQSTL